MERISWLILFINLITECFVEVYDEGTCTLKEVFENYPFVDGTPFGIKVEE